LIFKNPKKNSLFFYFQLIRSAEQAAHAAAEYLPAENTVRVLKPIIEQAKYPMNQSAIAMLQKTIELMNKETCTELMPEMIPPLLTVSLNFDLIKNKKAFI
jgi:hypothetical protein